MKHKGQFLVNLGIILHHSKFLTMFADDFEAIHNKDYSVVKTFKAGLIRVSLSLCELSENFVIFAR